MFLDILLAVLVLVCLCNLIVSISISVFIVRLADRVVGDMDAMAMTPTMTPPRPTRNLEELKTPQPFGPFIEGQPAGQTRA